MEMVRSELRLARTCTGHTSYYRTLLAPWLHVMCNVFPTRVSLCPCMIVFYVTSVVRNCVFVPPAPSSVCVNVITELKSVLEWFVSNNECNNEV